MVKARLLCLHGYAQNGDFFRQRTGSLRKALKAVADFTFVDAPHLATADFLGDVPEDRGAALGWFNVGERTPGARPAISAQYVGVQEALVRVSRAIADHGPFDGLLGFSQGATLAAYCCMHPEALAVSDKQPFRFAILFSAFSPRDPTFSLCLSEGDTLSSFPSFHCYGLSDSSVPAESSRLVASYFPQEGRVEHEHAGGHGVPSDARLRSALKSFIVASASGGPSASEVVGSRFQEGQADNESKRDGACDDAHAAADAPLMRSYARWRELRAL